MTMSSTGPDIRAYNEALVATLRSGDPAVLRRFARIWGDRLNNRGLNQLASATDAVVEKRLWMMIYDRPDLANLHSRAQAWLEQHHEDPSE
jgi:hypothetical protein